jgi:hypothetical protein
MKSTRLEVKNYLRGGLGAILEENDSRGTAGGSSGGSPRIEREEGEERKREERERKKKCSHGLNFSSVVSTSVV